MKKLFFTTLFFATAILASAQSRLKQEQMMQVNVQWSKQPEAEKILAESNFPSFKNFNQQITQHLQLVEEILRKRDQSQLTSTQRINRVKLLDELAFYHQLGNYPVNDYLTFKNPVFIDRNQTHCAVGYLMMVSGHDDLARQIDREQKFAYVHDIKVSGVKEWANEFGFTLDELAWIQPGYPPSFTTIDLTGGLNGTVTCTAVDSTGQYLFAGGEFTQSQSGQPCSFIAQYISGFAGWDWISVGTGLNGKVNAIVLQNNKLYVGGEFTMAGGNPANHVAMYDLQSGQWQALGSLDSLVNALAFYNNELYAGGKFSGMLAKWDGNQWIDFTGSYLYGNEVRSLEVFDSLLFIGGQFELPTGALRKNVLAWDGNQVVYSGFGTPTPVNDFAVYNNRIYAACDFVEGVDTCALSMLESGVWQTVLMPGVATPDFLVGTSLKTLLAVNQHFYAGGFFTASSLMTYGNHLVELNMDPSTGSVNYLSPLLLADSTINSLFTWNTNLGFAGAFVNSGITLNHIGVLTSVDVTGINSSDNRDPMILFPNPVKEGFNVMLPGNEKSCRLSVVDINGKNILVRTLFGSNHYIELPGLSAGVYVAVCQVGEKVYYRRFVKG